MSLTKEQRRLFATVCLALSSSLLILTDHFQGPNLGAAWIFLGLGAALSPSKTIGNKWVFVSLLSLIGLAYFSILGSVLWGYGFWEQTLSLAVWMTPLLGFYIIDIDRGLLKWWIPLLALQALVIVIQGSFLGEIRSTGLTAHPGVSGGILLVGIIILVLDSPKKWQILIPLFVIAILFTGSRLSILVLVLILIGFFLVTGFKYLRVYLTNHPILIGASLLPLLLLLVSPSTVPQGLRLDGNYTSTLQRDITSRTEVTEPLSLLPQGYFHSDGLHSVPTKVAAQMGIPAAVLLTVLTLWSLTRRPLFTSDWWILMSLVLMSILELYPWLGPLSVVWWLTIGWRTKHGDQQDSRVFRESDDSPEEKIPSTS